MNKADARTKTSVVWIVSLNRRMLYLHFLFCPFFLFTFEIYQNPTMPCPIARGTFAMIAAMAFFQSLL